VEADLAVTGVFNISSRNVTLEELAMIVADGLMQFGIEAAIHTENRTDVRSYRVSTEKAASVLNFKPKKPMSETVSDVITKAMAQPVADLEHPRYYNIRQMERHMAEGLLHGNGHGNGQAVRPNEVVGTSVGK
jgi:nucleoside-diphosphate-sugar epimerase